MSNSKQHQDVNPYNENDWLLRHKRNVTSQFGEDGILEEILSIIPDSDSWCVEFGAGNGLYLSNTFNLINKKNWSSIQIEADCGDYQSLQERYRDNQKVTCLNELISFEGDNSLDKVLSRTVIPDRFDLLSIDVDGNDYHIWNSLQKYRPKIVLIEFNLSIPHYISYIQPRNMDVNQGSSLAALKTLGKEKKYELICSTECNAFFVDDKYYDLFNISDNSIWKMNHNYLFWTYVFQLYDGRVIVGGNNHLLWHNIEVDLSEIEELVQIIPTEEIGFPGRPQGTK